MKLKSIEDSKKYHEIEALKANIKEVLTTIQQVRKATKKLQKQNRQISTKSNEDTSIYEINSSKENTRQQLLKNELDLIKREVQVNCISIDKDISWDKLNNLTRKTYDNLTKNDKQFAKIVKSLFFPNNESISNVFLNNTDKTKWKKHLTDLQIIIEDKKGISFGEYIFKENLRFSKEIYEFYLEISPFSKNFEREYIRKITRDFFDLYGSEIIHNIEGRYNLTHSEAKVFTIYLASMSGFDKGVLGFDYNAMHEFFQNAWMKINSNQDEFRKMKRTTRNGVKHIIPFDISRIKENITLGFDSYFALLESGSFELWFSEQKCGNGYTICKNFKDIDVPLHKSIYNLAKTRTNKKFQNLLLKSGFSVQQSIDFSNALFKRYTYYYDALGNSFLQKINFYKYTHDLILGLKEHDVSNPEKLAMDAIQSAKDSHRLIALMQNGYTLDDSEEPTKHLKLKIKNKKPLYIVGDIFTFLPIENDKGEYIISITGYSENDLKNLKKTNSKINLNVYEELNSIFKSISLKKNLGIKKMLVSEDFSKVLLTSYNSLLHDIFLYFANNNDFVSFQSLKNGKTFVCSEIASEEISSLKKWIRENQQQYSAIPYHTNYIWKLPFFGKFREISRNNLTKLSKRKELAFKKLFSYNDKEVLSFLKEITSNEFSEVDFKQKVKSNPEHSLIFSILYLLKGNTWLKLRKNLFEQGDTIRSLMFLDEKGNPVRAFEKDKDFKGKDNPILNFKIDFNEIFSINRLLDKNLLSTFPIAIKSGKSTTRYSELKFRFCRVDGKRAGEKGKRARELYIERIREKLSHIEEVNDMIEILCSKPAISFNLLRSANRESMMKLFIYLLFEYYEVWEEFTNSLLMYLTKNFQFNAKNMVLGKKFRNSGWDIILKSIKEDSDNRWIIHYVVRNNTSKIVERKIKVLPAFVNVLNKNTSKEKFGYMKELTLFCNYNSLYLRFLSSLRDEIMPLFLEDNQDGLNSKSSTNLTNIVEWMEKVCK